MTPEEIRCFCQEKGATVWVESPGGTITYSSKGIQIGPAIFAWQGEPPPPNTFLQGVLEKVDKFIIQPKFRDKKEFSRGGFERLLKA